MSSKKHKLRNQHEAKKYYESIEQVEESETIPSVEKFEKVYKTSFVKPKTEVFTKSYAYPKVEKIEKTYEISEPYEEVYETEIVKPVVEKIYTSSKVMKNAEVDRFQDATANIAASILPNVNEFYILFKNNEENAEENEFDEDRKICINRDTMDKIFKMAKIPKKLMTAYILFTFVMLKKQKETNKKETGIKEASIKETNIKENKKDTKINYKNLLKVIENFYVSFPKEDDDENEEEENDVEINKKTLIKIFDLMNIPVNERINILSFYEVED